MKYLVRVLAQYTDENGKNKGGQEFTFRFDLDNMMYTDKDKLTNGIQVAINKAMEGYAGHYTYIEHEVIFSEVVELDAELIEQTIDASYKAEQFQELVQEAIEYDYEDVVQMLYKANGGK